VSADANKILAAQGLRAAAYGFGSILLGASLEAQGWSPGRVGLLLAAIVAGNALTSFAVGRYADRLGRRRCYALLFVALALSGCVFGLIESLWPLVLVAMTGTLSTEVVESGPFTSLEQAMLPAVVERSRRARIFGTYNAVATVAGSLGALAAGGPELMARVWPGVAPDQRFFLVFVPVGLAGTALAGSLGEGAEAGTEASRSMEGTALRRSRANVARLCGLFAMDSFAGGFVIQSLIAYWLARRFGVSLQVLGMVFFGAGLLQTGSFLVATRLAERIGLLPTMVLTHLPSNLLLAAIPLAPTAPVAVALLLGRFSLSQMDVPTRQAYVVALVDPQERTAAAAYTNTARYAVRPFGTLFAGVVQQLALGLPFVIGGGIKALYDLLIWRWFRTVPLADEPSPPSGPCGSDGDRFRPLDSRTRHSRQAGDCP
jgi:MFS family permease